MYALIKFYDSDHNVLQIVFTLLKLVM